MPLKISHAVNKIFLALAIFGFLAVAASALAATGDYVPLVQIPGIPAGADFLGYLKGIYNFLISIVGILAMAALVYGGFRYLTSVGNPAAVEDAKDIINSAIIGLVLALSSWLILNEINPDILVLKKPGQIGALPGKYAYKESSFAKCFTNVDDPGYGTEANPCQCLDGTSQYSTKTRTNLTLSGAPSSISIGGTMTASGKLTDATGAGISGKSISITVSNAAVNGSGSTSNCSWINWMFGSCVTITTGPGGTFSIPLGPSVCVATEQWQAVFNGDPTYLPTGSGIVSVATNPPGTDCTQGNYPVKSAATFMSSSICQNLCSDPNAASDGKYHCLKADVRIGWVPDDNPGAYTLEQLRAMAATSTSAEAPYQTVEGGKYIIDMGKYSTVLNKPAIYRLDTTRSGGGLPDGVCDTNDAIFNQGDWGIITAYIPPGLLPSPYICKASQAPKGITCAQKVCVDDSAVPPNHAENTLYLTILAK